MITTLSVFKPWDRTRYGRRKQEERRERASLMSLSPITTAKHHEFQQTPLAIPPTLHDPDNETTAGRPVGLKILLAVIGVIVAGFVVLHLTGSGLGSHGH